MFIIVVLFALLSYYCWIGWTLAGGLLKEAEASKDIHETY